MAAGCCSRTRTGGEQTLERQNQNREGCSDFGSPTEFWLPPDDSGWLTTRNTVGFGEHLGPAVNAPPSSYSRVYGTTVAHQLLPTRSIPQVDEPNKPENND